MPPVSSSRYPSKVMASQAMIVGIKDGKEAKRLQHHVHDPSRAAQPQGVTSGKLAILGARIAELVVKKLLHFPTLPLSQYCSTSKAVTKHHKQIKANW